MVIMDYKKIEECLLQLAEQVSDLEPDEPFANIIGSFLQIKTYSEVVVDYMLKKSGAKDLYGMSTVGFFDHIEPEIEPQYEPATE